MNVGFVNATHRWGGVKTWTLDVAPRLRDRGHEVRLWLRRGDPFADACRERGLAVEDMVFGPDWNPVAIARLRRGLRSRDIEVVVTNVSKDNRIAGPAARSLGLPVVQIVGGPGDLTDRARVRLEQRRYVTRVVVPAESVRDTLAAFPWMEVSRRVQVLWNAVDLDFFRPGEGAGCLRRELGVEGSVPVVLTTGQLTSIKGHALLLEAIAGWGPPRAVLALTSRGPEETPLREQARALGLAERVHFLGFRPREEMPRLLEDADLVVQPSLQEGLPISVLEFMAKGKAILATAISGVPEAIEDGVEGILIPPGDVPALGSAMARLLADPELRRRLGVAARRRVERDFGLPALVERFEAMLADVVHRGRADQSDPERTAAVSGKIR